MRYKAFISYKHERSSAFASRLEFALKRYAKPFFRRPMRIFRDEIHLAPGVNLSEMIRAALEDSEFLILLASPEAATSPWVEDELDLWCSNHSRVDRLIIVLTAGKIETLPSHEIDWDRTDALPEVLKRNLGSIPLWVDLRWADAPELQDVKHPEFKRAVNQISARLRGIDPNEMLGVEVREYRRRKAWISASVTAIVVASLAAVFWGLVARERGILAEQRLLSATRTANEVQVTLNHELSQVPGAAPVRKKLLDLSTDLLARLKGDEHPEVFHTQAIAKIEAGDLAHERGDLPKAARLYADAGNLFNRALGYDPTNGWIVEELLLTSLKEGGIAEERGHLTDAKRRYQEARRIAQKLVHSADSDPRWKLRLASALEHLADVAEKTGDTKEEEDLLVAAQEYRHAVADASLPEDRLDRTVGLLKLGDLYQATGRSEAARENYETGLMEVAALLKTEPLRADFRYWWAVFAERFGRPAELTMAADSLAEMVKAEPDRAEWVRELAILHTKLGEAALIGGDVGAARERFAKAETLLGHLAALPAGSVNNRRLRAELLDRLGDAIKSLGVEDPAPLYEMALSAKVQLAEVSPDDRVVRRGIAATHSKLADWSLRQNRLSEAREHVTAAREILEELTERAPNRVDWLADLASVLEIRARLEPRTDTLQRAVDLRRRVLHHSVGPDLGAETALANALLLMAEAIDGTDSHGATAAYQDAEERLRRITQSSSAPDRAWEVLAVVLERQGRRAPEADLKIRFLDEAARIARDRSSSRPEDDHWADLKAGFLEELASAVQATDPQRVRSSLEESLEIRVRLAKERPLDLSAQRNLAVIHYRLGDANRAAGNLEEATRQFDKGLVVAWGLTQREPPHKKSLNDVIELAAALANLAINQEDWSGGKAYVERIVAARTDLLRGHHDGSPLSDEEKDVQQRAMEKNGKNLAALQRILAEQEGAHQPGTESTGVANQALN